MTNIMDDSDFESRTDLFVSWLSEVGIVLSPKAKIVDLRKEGRGRGVVASVDFEEDETIFTIPRSAVLNTVTGCAGLGVEQQDAINAMPAWLGLTFLLQAEFQKKSSRFAPYLAILPTHLDSLIFWSKEELTELQGSAVVNKIGKASAEALFIEYIAPLGLPAVDTTTCHQAASVIMAYAFDIPDDTPHHDQEETPDGEGDLVSDSGEEKTLLSMIPLADMLNADADKNNAKLCCDDGEVLEMKAIQHISAGEEVFNDYGSLPTCDLLRRYGYVSERYSPYDVVEISADIVFLTIQDLAAHPTNKMIAALTTDQLEGRKELASREDVLEESYDIGYSDDDGPGIPTELIALLYLLLLNKDSLYAIRTSQAELPSRSKLSTELVGQVLEQVLERRMKEYATTIEQDEDFVRSGDLSGRKLMATTVRLGEKRVLREALKEAALFKGDNRRMRAIQEPPTSKRKFEHETTTKKKSRTR